MTKFAGFYFYEDGVEWENLLSMMSKFQERLEVLWEYPEGEELCPDLAEAINLIVEQLRGAIPICRHGNISTSANPRYQNQVCIRIELEEGSLTLDDKMKLPSPVDCTETEEPPTVEPPKVFGKLHLVHSST